MQLTLWIFKCRFSRGLRNVAAVVSVALTYMHTQVSTGLKTQEDRHPCSLMLAYFGKHTLTNTHTPPAALCFYTKKNTTFVHFSQARARTQDTHACTSLGHSRTNASKMFKITPSYLILTQGVIYRNHRSRIHFRGSEIISTNRLKDKSSGSLRACWRSQFTYC